MTDEQINAAIAEILGITRGIPDFCGDLNEMHGAEKVLAERDHMFYQAHLSFVTGNSKVVGSWPLIQATARQRAEAFLRTLGKWKEGE